MTKWHTILWTDKKGRSRMDKIRGKSDTDARAKLAALCPAFKAVSPEPCEDCARNRSDGYGPSHNGSARCRMRTSIACGGTRAHCTCSACF